MNKICTSIEQSKKLLELGIDVNIADMLYRWHDERWYCVPKDVPYPYSLKDMIPAWSLSVLLNILADQSFRIKAESKWKDTIKVGYEFNIAIPIRHCKIWFPSLLDAAFEMVCWLKKEEYI